MLDVHRVTQRTRLYPFKWTKEGHCSPVIQLQDKIISKYREIESFVLPRRNYLASKYIVLDPSNNFF